jgi:GNAT superfamily N-acetyltransferase
MNDLDFSDLTDDQLVSLIRLACAEAVRRGADCEASARAAFLTEAEKAVIAREARERAAEAIRREEIRRIEQEETARARRRQDAERADEAAEPGLRGRVFMCSTRREAIVCDDRVVGFVTPRRTKVGWRHGPIYVLPEFRGRGLVAAYYATHPERDCVAFVRDTNKPSRSAHERAGFKNWRRGPGGWFMRREPLEEA